METSPTINRGRWIGMRNQRALARRSRNEKGVFNGGGRRKINADKRRIERGSPLIGRPIGQTRASIDLRKEGDADHGEGERAQDSWAGSPPIDRSRHEEQTRDRRATGSFPV